MTHAEIRLGDLARDTLTGFTGVVTARTEWLNGCVRLTLQPCKLDKDGTPAKEITFDVEQLEATKTTKAPKHRPAGGPCPDPIRPSNPGRR